MRILCDPFSDFHRLLFRWDQKDRRRLAERVLDVQIIGTLGFCAIQVSFLCNLDSSMHMYY